MCVSPARWPASFSREGTHYGATHSDCSSVGCGGAPQISTRDDQPAQVCLRREGCGLVCVFAISTPREPRRRGRRPVLSAAGLYRNRGIHPRCRAQRTPVNRYVPFIASLNAAQFCVDGRIESPSGRSWPQQQTPDVSVQCLVDCVAHLGLDRVVVVLLADVPGTISPKCVPADFAPASHRSSATLSRCPRPSRAVFRRIVPSPPRQPRPECALRRLIECSLEPVLPRPRWSACPGASMSSYSLMSMLIFMAMGALLARLRAARWSALSRTASSASTGAPGDSGRCCCTSDRSSLTRVILLSASTTG